ncbi:type II toxin-antitoxin system Phd/YefM family antitoxin [Duganella rhizosphaerae]|uniref:type II toxin-antitoxin system Phd/YefM family antitoxin n=1 Tax=Duganella rhizosphaerae TaxID=2885763 RepID=UPI00403F8487
MAIFDIDEAKIKLSRLIEDASHGQEVIIAAGGKPIVRLVAIHAHTALRKPGSMKGKIWIADDFDGPLPDDIQAAFEGQ